MRSAGTNWVARRLTAASFDRIESNLKVWALKLKSLQEFEGLYIAIGQKAAGRFFGRYLDGLWKRLPISEHPNKLTLLSSSRLPRRRTPFYEHVTPVYANIDFKHLISFE